MKHGFGALILSVGMIVTALAGEPEQGNPVQGPRIFCEEPNFDFGTVDNQTSIDHTFVLKNIGDTTLEISNIRAACGCTVADVSSKVLAPGEESRMTARLNLQGRTGHQSKPITIFSNDPQTPQLRVNMSGVAQQSILVSPERLMFGQIGPGQEMTLSVDLQNLSPQPFSIQSVDAADPHIKVVTEIVEENLRHRVNITITGPNQPGSFNSILRINTDHPGRPAIDIPLFAHVVGELVFAPPEIALPADSAGNPLTRYIVIRPGSLAAFEVTSVELPDDQMRHNIFPFGGQGYRIQLENILPTKELDGKEIRIKTTAEFMSEIIVPIRITQ